MKNIFSILIIMSVHGLLPTFAQEKNGSIATSGTNKNVCTIKTVGSAKCWWGRQFGFGLSNFPKSFTSCIVKINGVICQTEPILPEELIDGIQSVQIKSVPMGTGSGSITVELDGTKITGPIITYIKTSKPAIRPFVKTGIAGKDPSGFCTDEIGNIYIADRSANRILKIESNSIISTVFAGTGIKASIDGRKDTAKFDAPTAICLDSRGSFYIAEKTKIRKITPEGTVSTLAGSFNGSYADGIGERAGFMNLTALCIDLAGNIYAADSSRIRMIRPDGMVSTLAGSTTTGNLDGQGTEAQFGARISSICVDQERNVLAADYYNHRIRKINSVGVVMSVNAVYDAEDINYVSGESNEAGFFFPKSIYVDNQNAIFVITGRNTTQDSPRLVRLSSDFRLKTMGPGPVFIGKLYNPVGLIPNRKTNIPGNFLVLEPASGIAVTSYIASIVFE